MEAPHNLEKRDNLMHPTEGGTTTPGAPNTIATPDFEPAERPVERSSGEGATSDRSSVNQEPSDNVDLEKAQSRRDFDRRQPVDDIEKQQPPPNEQHAGDEKDPNLVEWDGPDDPENPINWPTRKKWISTLALSFVTFTITFASSVFSTATQVTAIEFGVSDEVMILGTSLFVLGFAFGPLVWGPASELFGRKIPLLVGYSVFAIFQIPVAVTDNIQTVMICRFFGGMFGSAPLAIVGGALADFFDPIDRGVAICIFAAATFIGPVAGPIMGGFITQSYLGWRWTAWITLIMAALFGLIALFGYSESSGPYLLQQKAKRLRFETRNWAIHAKADENMVDVKQILTRYLSRPFHMLALEPILLLITIYMAFVYGVLYLFFEAYPIAFQQARGWNLGVGALPFLGITGGVLLGGSIIIYMTKTRFARLHRANGGKVLPEERLPPMIIGGVLLPIGLFWFAWTSDPSISWVPQVLAGIPIGAGVLMIFMQGLNYIIDVYRMNANSGIAANTFLRSLAGAGFPLFATYMYNKLGIGWATSLLGFLCVVMTPVPVLFYIYGKRIRSYSRFSPT